LTFSFHFWFILSIVLYLYSYCPHFGPPPVLTILSPYPCITFPICILSPPQSSLFCPHQSSPCPISSCAALTISPPPLVHCDTRKRMFRSPRPFYVSWRSNRPAIGPCRSFETSTARASPGDQEPVSGRRVHFLDVAGIFEILQSLNVRGSKYY
jgi:hypothetical protein